MNISNTLSRMTPSFAPRSSSAAATPTSSSSRREPARAPASRDESSLPLFGNPNHLTSPATHYFPSVTRDERARMVQKRSHQAQLGRPPHPDPLVHRDAALPPIPTQQQTQQPGQPPAQRRRCEPEWSSVAELEQGDDRDDQNSDTEMELDQEPTRGGTGLEEQEPAKKRSRTLTTAHQTAFLTALLAKTRFPSTETREEVGLEIGMSARRVQIWFQNRRQSQKRARERDGTEPGSTLAHAGGHPYAINQSSGHDYLSNDPYRHSHRYSSHSGSTGLSRQASTDSLGSISSFTSAKTTQTTHHHRQPDPFAREPESRNHRPMAWAAGNVFPPPPAATAHRVYATVPRSDHAGPREQHHHEQLDTRRVSSHSMNEVRLPSLSSVVGSALPQSAPHVEFPSSRAISPPLFAYEPPPPLSTTQSFQSGRTVHRVTLVPSFVSSPSSSATTLPRFDADEFSRLRISGTSSSSAALRDQNSINSLRHGRTASTASSHVHDVLDQAMETMHRPAPTNPPRSSLPPLRLQPLRSFEPLRTLDHIGRPAGSEADAALLAPIRRASDTGPALPSKQNIRLPPISSFSSHSSSSSNASNITVTQITPPGHHADETGSSTSSASPSTSSSSHPPLHSPPLTGHRSNLTAASLSTTASQSTHRTPARSSISSFDTLGSGWAAGGGPSLASSRTSFSSEVTEEWERHSATLGRTLSCMPGRNLSLGGAGSVAVGPTPPRDGGWSFKQRSPEGMQGWESLVRQAGSAAVLSPEQLEESVCHALLAQLALHSAPTLAVCGYLRHGVGLKASPSGSKSLVRPGFLARRALETCVPAALDVVLAAVNDTVQTADAAVYTATTVADALEAVTRASALLAARAVGELPLSSQSPAVAYVQLLLARPPLPWATLAADEDSLQPALTAIRSALDALASRDAAPAESAVREQLHTQLQGVAALLDKTPQEDTAPPIDLNEATSFPDPDVAFLMADLLNRSCEFYGLSNGPAAVARITALLKLRIAESSSRGSTAESSLSSAFLEILLAATAELRKGESKSVIHECFAYARLPQVLRAIFVKGGLLDESIADGLQGCLEGAFRKFKAIISPSTDADSMDVDESPNGALLNALLTGFCRQELISIDVGASLGDGLHPEDLQPQHPQDFYHRLVVEGDPDGIREVLGSLATDFWSQSAIIQALQQAIETWTRDHDLSALASVCTMLVDMPDALEVAFLHVEPRVLLKPVCDFLESFDSSIETFGDGHPIEPYGVIVLFLQVIVSRFNLMPNLAHHLGNEHGFFCRWIPSMAAVYSLSDMSDESKSVIDSWISDLFGEGISDDLLQSTKPHLLLRVAPTICKQFLAAFHAGVVDMVSLRDACAYFHQDLLSFTLPGIIHWLTGEIRRTQPSPALSAMHEVLQVFVFAETLPHAVLELVSMDLLPLATASGAAEPLDTDRLAKLLAPFGWAVVPEHSSQKPPTWLHQLEADLTASVDSPATIRPNISVSLTKALLNASTLEVVSGVLTRLLSLARRLPLVFDEDAVRRSTRIRRAAATLGAPGPDDVRTWPLLMCLMDEVATSTVHALAAATEPPHRGKEARINDFAAIVAAAVSAALALANETGVSPEDNQIEIILDRFAAVVRMARSKVEATKGADGRALEIFVDRFLSQEGLTGSRNWA